jgi:hypothetical protein
MKWIVAIAALLTAAPTTPQEPIGQGTRWFDGNPPARFDGTGAVIVVMVNDVGPYCGDAPEGLRVIACTVHTKAGTPIIIMPSPKPYNEVGDEYAHILNHELAHAQGWPGTHPAD